MNGWTLDQMADLAAQDIEDGAYVNLGIGLPELVADHLPPDREILLHSENGLLGMGPKPAPHERDSELINAGKKPTTLLPRNTVPTNRNSMTSSAEAIGLKNT